MGFLKFLLAIGLIILGGILMLAAISGCAMIGLQNSMSGGNTSPAVTWVMGVIGFITLLGGIYMLRNK